MEEGLSERKYFAALVLLERGAVWEAGWGLGDKQVQQPAHTLV